MDELSRRRRRLSPWVLGLVALVVNFPVVNHLLIDRTIDRSGVDVEAELVSASRSDESPGADHGLAFRFDEGVDPAQSLWTVEVDRATYQRALAEDVVEVRVLPGRPTAFEVEGQVATRLGWYVTGVADVVLVVVAVALWRRGRGRPGDAPRGDTVAADPGPVPDVPVPVLAEARDMLQLEALEDVHRQVPELGPPAGFEELGGATYLVTGEVARIGPDAVVLDTGARQVRVVLGSHTNRVGLQQPGQVLARVPHALSG